MKTIHFACLRRFTALYLVQAIQQSFAVNPDTRFTLACVPEVQAELKQFCDDERLKFVDLTPDDEKNLFDPIFEYEVNVCLSVPMAVIKTFRVFAEQLGFTSGINNENDLLFPLNARYTSTARILFINHPSTLFDRNQMDSLIQSIGDRRYTIITTLPSRAGNSVWQADRTLSEYAHIASHADYVIGVPTEHMAVAFNRGSINYCRGWISFWKHNLFPFNQRSRHASSWSDVVEKLRQEGLV